MWPIDLEFLWFTKGFCGGSDSRESTCNAGDLGSIPGLGRSLGEGHDNPTQYSCLENPDGQRSLMGYSPWGHKQLDMTERLRAAQHMEWISHGCGLEQLSAFQWNERKDHLLA